MRLVRHGGDALMGWRQVEFPLLVLTPSGGFTGLFVYSGAPAAGNLILSIAAAAGTDPFGNPFPGNLTSYFAGIPGRYLNMNAGGLIFQLPAPAVFTGLLSALTGAGATGVPSVGLLSPSNVNSGTNDSEAFISAVGRSADGTVGPYVVLGALQQGAANVQPIPVYAVGGQLSYAAPGVPGGLLVPEPWHHITTGAPAGWTIDIGYKFLALLGLVMVQVIASVANGTVVTFAETIATLPAGPPSYQPSNGKGFDCAFFNGSVDSSQPFVIQAGGAIQYAGAGFTAGATAQFVGQVIFTTQI